MEDRQKNLLKLIIESFIKTAEPVGSKFLVSEFELELSDATVRNEMRFLEETGYLAQPHTSAGRIPTETGYRLYVEELMGQPSVSKKTTEVLEHAVDGLKGEDAVKALSRAMAEEIHAAVIVAFGTERVYYTGLSELFAQPEFKNSEYTLNASEMFDQAEELVGDLFERVPQGKPQVFIGSQNPLGPHLSLVSVQLPQEIIINVMGPLRFDYKKAIGVTQILSSIFK